MSDKSQENLKVGGVHYQISAPARQAARVLMRNFDMRQRGAYPATENNVAIIVDVTTNIFRVQNALDYVVQRTPWLDKHELGKNLEMMREAIRMLELVNNRLPRYQNGITSLVDSHNNPISKE